MECKERTIENWEGGKRVLIETLWNVKSNQREVDACKYRINRNIVECKVLNYRKIDLICSVLIETLWNVKSTETIYTMAVVSINRNIVECKVFSASCRLSFGSAY